MPPSADLFAWAQSRYASIVKTSQGGVRWIWGLSALPLIVVLCGHIATLPMDNGDNVLHILMGRDILTHWRLTGNPEWTYGPANADWVTFVHWPTQVLMAVGYDAVGFGFFSAFHVLLGGLLMLTMFVALRAVGRNTVVDSRLQAATLLFTCLAVGLFLTPRANAFSAVFAVLLGYWCLSIIRSGAFGMRWWIVPLATWVWVLLHGSAMLAIPFLSLAIALWWVIQSARFTKRTLAQAGRLAAVALLSLLTTLLTPLGARSWVSAYDLWQASRGWMIEWSPVPAASPEAAFIAVLVLVTIVAAVRGMRLHGHNRMQALAVLALLASAIVLSGLQQRNYIIGIPLAIVLVFWLLGHTLGEGRARPWELLSPEVASRRVIALGVGITLIVSIVGLAFGDIDRERFPVETAERLAASNSDGGRKILAPIEVAAQIPFYAPGNQVAFDIRIDRYPREALVKTNTMLWRGDPAWQQWIEDEFPDTTDMLIPKTSPLVAQAQQAGWRVVDESPRWVLVSRPSGADAVP